MKKKEIQLAIDKEIDWCKAHPKSLYWLPPNNTEEFRVGFISGLIQANRIIEELSKKKKNVA